MKNVKKIKSFDTFEIIIYNVFRIEHSGLGRYGRGGNMEENNAQVIDTNVEDKGTKTLSFDEMLASNKEYQSEFDRRLAKSNNTYLENEKTKWVKEYEAKIEAERNEAEKLAKMNVEQQLNYKIEQLEKQLSESNGRLNASSLRETTSDILNEKGIPLSYLKMFDFNTENADTINQKIEMLNDIRNQDLEERINQSFRQSSPRQVRNEIEEIDPYIEGFKSEL